MNRFAITLILIFSALSYPGKTQEKSEITVAKIMQDPDQWIGTLPQSPYWATDGSVFYFEWKKDSAGIRQVYTASPAHPDPVPASDEAVARRIPENAISNRSRTRKVYSRNTNIFIYDIPTGHEEQLTFTSSRKNVLGFSSGDTAIYYQEGNNVFRLSLGDHRIFQLTDLHKGNPPSERKSGKTPEEWWLYHQQMEMFSVLKEREKKELARQRYRDKFRTKDLLKPHYLGSNTPARFTVSPDGKFVTWLVYHRPEGAKNTEIPHFVTESGFTETQRARTKAGTPYFTGVDLYIFNLEQDTIYQAKTDDIPGLHDIPEYWKDYPDRDTAGFVRGVAFSAPNWFREGSLAFVDIGSLDYKDRWIMLLNPETGSLKLIDRQHDDAWIGGPGIGWWGSNSGWMPDGKHIWFQSERTGYSHLYTANIESGRIKALTKGKFEIYNPFLSQNYRYWYFTSNETHPGERHFYRMDLNGKNKIKLTSMPGRNDVTLSPDEKYMVIRYSYANKPWELFLQENNPEGKPMQITHSLTNEFLSYQWREPEFITFKARDGVRVPARLYRPEKVTPGSPAVIFVHGAGYLQNAHKWWSSYFREYMFHNLLVDKGYIVLDMDYRGSAGYGRDWRTAIYRHMGGKDLDDQVDGARFLISEYQVDPNKIGIYGGSYGGFITLMALFTQPGIFQAGAALRPVTDWAHYNHGYTAEILNTPVEDSLAYVRSSPIYFASGLQDHLLICHGMIDDNVHFQDVVRLAQRLIELGKENWELAVFPLERHSFVEPSSWTDEYKRILKLFETTLK